MKREWRGIALGHLIGVSRCRILVTLFHEMHLHNAGNRLASLRISGGMGLAIALQRD